MRRISRPRGGTHACVGEHDGGGGRPCLTSVPLSLARIWVIASTSPTYTSCPLFWRGWKGSTPRSLRRAAAVRKRAACITQKTSVAKAKWMNRLWCMDPSSFDLQPLNIFSIDVFSYCRETIESNKSSNISTLSIWPLQFTDLSLYVV